MTTDENQTPDPMGATSITARPWWRVLAAVQIVGLIVSTITFMVGRSGVLLRDPWNLLFFVGIFGYLAGQTAIAAIATTLGPGSWLRRFTVPPLLLLTQVILQVSVLAAVLDAAAFAAALAALMLWGVVQIPLWMARYGLGWRVLAGSERTTASSTEQFTIRQFLLFTLVVAAALGLGKLAVGDDLLLDFFPSDFRSVLAFCIVFASIAAMATTTTYFTLRPGRLATILAVGTVVAAILAFATNIATFSVTQPNDLEAYLFVTLMLFAQHLWTSLNLLQLRRAGYRLKRISA